MTANTAVKVVFNYLWELSALGAAMDNLTSLEFLSQQFDLVLKTWAIIIPIFLLLIWVAWKMKGIFKG